MIGWLESDRLLAQSYQDLTTQKKDDVKSYYADIQKQFKKNSSLYSSFSVTSQSTLTTNQTTTVDQNQVDFQNFLKDIGYKGKNIGKLSQDEAKKLVSSDGFFGVDQTANRIANFVIQGANGDENLLKAGKAGIQQGFKDAEAVWGSKLPDISYQTIDKAVQSINDAMSKLGFSTLDTTA